MTERLALFSMLCNFYQVILLLNLGITVDASR